MGPLLGLGLAALPWAARYAPQIGRGAQTLWGLGRGMGTPAGRAAAGDALVSGTGRASKYMRGHPIKSSIGLGAGGLVAGSMFEGDPEATPAAMPMPSGAAPVGPPMQQAPFNPNLPSYTERAQANRQKYMDNMSTIIKHSILLQFQNPGRKNSYMKDAIAMVKAGAAHDNEVEVAKMMDSVFKDNTVPMSAKTIYNRMLKAGASPKEAASVSGYSLEIEKTEAQAAADMARSQPKLSDIYSKPALMMKTVQDEYARNPENAIQTLAMWLKTEVIKMPDAYARYQPKTDQDYFKLAAAILGSEGTAEVAAPVGEVTNIGLD